MKRTRVIFWAAFMMMLAAVAFQGICRCLEAKGSYGKNGDFFGVAEECDVLFLGTSHVTTEVYPMELWREYGIASYNMSGYGHPMPMSYWALMNALDYAEPKVVVVDCYAMESDALSAEDKKFMHFTLDSMPISRTKVRAVCDIYDDFDERMEYLWDFSIYHERWHDIDRDDFEVEYGKTRGAIFEIGLSEPDEFVLKDVKAEPIKSSGVEYLRRIVEECRSRDIKVVLTFLPFPAQEDQQKVAAYAGEIAKEYGVDYLNFLQMDLIDYQTDCFDSYSHLNVSGGHKITSFMGEYLRDKCAVPDHRQDGAVNWDEDYAAYQSYKVERLQAQESLQNNLIMMEDKSFSFCFFVDGKSKIWDYDQYVNQVKNLAPGHNFHVLEEAMEREEDYCLIVDGLNGSVTEYCGADGGTVETSFGTVKYKEGEEGRKELYVGASEQSYLAETCEDGRIPTVQVVLVNNLDGTVVNVARFDESLRLTK